VSGEGHTLTRGLTLLVSGRCNLACAYCYQDAGDHAPRLDWKTAREGVAALVRSGAPSPRLEFSGGEPLLEERLIRRTVAYAESVRPAETRCQYVLTTNGTLLTSDMLAFLVAHDVALQLSFDGAREAQRYRGPRTFKVLDRLLDLILKEHPDYYRRRVQIGMTLMAATIPTLADSIRYLLGKGVTAISVVPRTTWDPDWTAASRDLLRQQVEQVLEISLDHWRRTGLVPVGFLRGRNTAPAAAHGRTFLCAAPRAAAVCVEPGGRAFACTMFARSWHVLPPLARAAGKLLDLGDIRDPALQERIEALPRRARRLPLLTNKRAKHSSYGRCAECKFRADCFVCPAAIAHIPGNDDPHLIPDFPCAFNQMTLAARRQFNKRKGKRGSPEREVLTLVSQALDILEAAAR
jgi:sulfatase maturation enzyme AslB (radical SAM superfamily)